MIKGYTKRLIFWIFVVMCLLLVCISIDYADNNTITDNGEMRNNNTYDLEVYDNESVIGVEDNESNIVVRTNDRIYKVNERIKETEKKSKTVQTITMTGKPSCSRCARNGCSYTWRTRTYINYCPHCHHYGCLGNKHKFGSRYEQEISCFVCDSDFCINCGKTKYSWSNVYLMKA